MNNRLTIGDFSELLAKATGKDNEEITRFFREFVSVVNEGLFADKIVKINTIGTFKIILVEKRESIDVNTKERILIPEHFKLSFLPDKDMRTMVNKPFEAFDTILLEDGTDPALLFTPESNDEDIDEENEAYETLNMAQDADNNDETVIIKGEEIPQITETISQEHPAEDTMILPETMEETSILTEEQYTTETNIPPLPPPPPPIAPPPAPPGEPEDEPRDEPEDTQEKQEDTREEPEQQEEEIKEIINETNNKTEQYNYDEYIFTENESKTEQILEEEDMEDFKGNRRRPEPVPYRSGSATNSSTSNTVWMTAIGCAIVILITVLGWILLKPTKHKPKVEDNYAGIQLPPAAQRANDVAPETDDMTIGGFIEEDPVIEPASPRTGKAQNARPLKEIKPIKEKEKASGSYQSATVKSPTTKAAPYVGRTSIVTKKGDRLNLLALDYYGKKEFWVYIYLENQSKIKNPNSLPVGITVTIPSSKDYDINRYSQLSLKKAFALQRDILNDVAANKKPASSSNSGYGGGGYGGGGYDNSYGSGDQGGYGDYGSDGGDGSGDYGSDDGGDFGGYGSDDGGFGSDDGGDYGVSLKAQPKSKTGKTTVIRSSTKRSRMLKTL